MRAHVLPPPLCRPDVTYHTSSCHGGAETERAVELALQDVARGSKLRGACRAHDAPYSTVRNRWSELGGDRQTQAWKAFCASVPEAAEGLDGETPAEESPLGPRLRRRSCRRRATG